MINRAPKSELIESGREADTHARMKVMSRMMIVVAVL